MNANINHANRFGLQGRQALVTGSVRGLGWEIAQAMAGTSVSLHFKDNGEMNESLFNILPYGNAQYMVPGDTWSTSRRTEDLRRYGSIEELLDRHDIDERLFRRYHELAR